MEVTTYYVTTLTNAFVKIGPVIVSLVLGYFIFVKLPFLFFLKNMKKSKEALKEKDSPHTVSKQAVYSLPPLSQGRRQEQKKEETKREHKKKEAPRKEAPTSDLSAESLFEIRTGEVLTKEGLRKKYHELIRMNHPDKVAALAPDFKKLADKKTKEINSAYAKLLKRAS